MSNRHLRDTARIDYQVLHSTGETVILDQLPRIPRQAESSDESSSSGLSDSGSDGSLNRTIVAIEPEIELISENLERISLTEMDLIKLQSLEETLYDDINWQMLRPDIVIWFLLELRVRNEMKRH